MATQFRFLASIGLTLFAFFFKNAVSQNEKDSKYWDCLEQYNCGTLGNVSYPFWGRSRLDYCGSGRDEFELQCRDDETTTIELGSKRFKVKEINQTAHTMRVVPEDLVNNNCEFIDTGLNATFFHYLPSVQNVTIFYGCNSEFSMGRNNFTCPVSSNCRAFYVNETQLQRFPELKKQCKSRSKVAALADIRLQPEGGIDVLKKALQQGFDVQYVADSDDCKACTASGGTCGVRMDDTSQFNCHCRDSQSGLLLCPNSDRQAKNVTPTAVAIGLVAVVAASGALGFCYYDYCRNRSLSSHSQNISRKSIKKSYEGDGIRFGVEVFNHCELEAATGNFDSASELGHGGFGTVYFGKLTDGRAVAIKRLYENNNERVKEFLNEVQILSRLRHPNLVSFYGCTSQHSHELLLVYEYIPNGTLADHLHGPKSEPGTLTWPIRLNIATEIASALVYLHASDIIHRDIKASNILLDEKLCAKIADFGLSRLFSENVSHVTTEPEGTPGYLDPEYHKSCQLTEKSDVYSFGVVLLELISSLPAVDTERLDDEVKLVDMASKKIQNQALHQLVDPRIGFEFDSRIRETITQVATLAFQCAQGEKELRPSMAEVWVTLASITKEEMKISVAK